MQPPEAITSNMTVSSHQTRQPAPLNQPADPQQQTRNTAHFSDEGDISEDDAAHATQQLLSSQQNSAKPAADITVLYQGPSSRQMAEAKAAAKPPPGPRPLLGDF